MGQVISPGPINPAVRPRANATPAPAPVCSVARSASPDVRRRPPVCLLVCSPSPHGARRTRGGVARPGGQQPGAEARCVRGRGKEGWPGAGGAGLGGCWRGPRAAGKVDGVGLCRTEKVLTLFVSWRELPPDRRNTSQLRLPPAQSRSRVDHVAPAHARPPAHQHFKLHVSVELTLTNIFPSRL